jgi:uncharacterized membrane protein
MLSYNQKIKLVRATYFFMRNWLVILIAILGIINILPFFAPLLMKLGLKDPANFIYLLYAPLCHQMAQRSFFLFGEQVMYAPQEFPISIAGNLVGDMFALRAFSGNETLGWKVAWSDRMVYMYGMAWLALIFYQKFKSRIKIKRINLFLFVILLMPMALDGISHVVSDFQGGLYEGFRYENEWLADLTSNILPQSFYIGDTLGTFNSWMRLISGIGFGIGIVWLVIPVIANSIIHDIEIIGQKLHYGH